MKRADFLSLKRAGALKPDVFVDSGTLSVSHIQYCNNFTI